MLLPLIISGVLFIAALLPFYSWYQIDFISTLLGMHNYQIHLMVKTGIIRIVKWYWFAIIPVAIGGWLLSFQTTRALFLRNKPERLFKLGSIAVAMMTGGSLLLIAMLVIANTAFIALAGHYTGLNKIKPYQGGHMLPSYKIRETDAIYIGKTLKQLQKGVTIPTLDDAILKKYRIEKAMEQTENDALKKLQEINNLD
jgi:hypothetical protein